MKKKTLYKRTSTGKIQEWTIEIEGEKYRTISGQTDGKLVTSSWTVCKPKNTDKSNATTPETQAIAEADAKYKKKLDTGYTESVNTVDSISENIKAVMLAKEYSNFNYLFPEPQYLGAKHSHLSWIKKFIPTSIETALDAFAGSQSVAFLFKQLGLKTITNDFLNFNHQIGLALIENNSEQLTKEDIQILFQPSENKKDFELIEKVYTDVFFEKADSYFLDNFRANIPLLESPFKQALAFTVMNRSMTRKITMGHFAHTQALNYASNPERVKRNRSLARPIKDIFEELLPKYNNAVFDTQQENKSFHQDILGLLPNLDKVDLAYFDPPYCDSHANYQSFYHLLETYTEYWKDKEFINGIKRYDPQRFSGFDKKKDVISSLNKLFDYAQEIPIWLFSYNDRSYPAVEDFAKMISKHRDVTVETKTYHNGRGGKGSVAGSREILFVCKPKKVFSMSATHKTELVNEGF